MQKIYLAVLNRALRSSRNRHSANISLLTELDPAFQLQELLISKGIATSFS